MRIVAWMPVFNEADVLPFVLAHNQRQGIEVHALDGWSTDGSYEILRDWGPGVTVERFPADGPCAEQQCRAILKRIEVLAPRSGADWCMLSDADEWRRSPRSGETLAEGIERVSGQGYNVIDYQVYFFLPTDDGWQALRDTYDWALTVPDLLRSRGNPENYFQHYTQDATIEMLCRIPQQKTWRNYGQPIELRGGGHQVWFEGARVSPELFTMKHYPYRSSEHGKRKLATRLQRRCHEEHRDGWGVHYDEYPPDFNFLWDPAKLSFWRDVEAPLP